MLKKLVFLLFLLLAVIGCFKNEDFTEETGISQEKKEVLKLKENKTGLNVLSKEKYKALPKQKIRVSRENLPLKVDLTEKLPKPGDQMYQGSCVGWAVAYAYKSMQEKNEENWNYDSEKHIFSPSFVYNQINGGRDGGSYFEDAFNLIVEKGCATLEDMPYDSNDYLTQPDEKVLNSALKYKAIAWSSLELNNIHQIKQNIYNGDAVVIGIPVYTDFDSINVNDKIFDKIDGEPRGYHAITLIGYDDNIKAFKLINSWGESWGIDGYGFISYDLISNPDIYIPAYVMVDDMNIKFTLKTDVNLITGNKLFFSGETSPEIKILNFYVDSYYLGKREVENEKYNFETVLNSSGENRKFKIIAYDNNGNIIRTLNRNINVKKIGEEVNELKVNNIEYIGENIYVSGGTKQGIEKVVFYMDGYKLGETEVNYNNFNYTFKVNTPGIKRKLESKLYNQAGELVDIMVKEIKILTRENIPFYIEERIEGNIGDIIKIEGTASSVIKKIKMIQNRWENGEPNHKETVVNVINNKFEFNYDTTEDKGISRYVEFKSYDAWGNEDEYIGRNIEVWPKGEFLLINEWDIYCYEFAYFQGKAPKEVKYVKATVDGYPLNSNPIVENERFYLEALFTVANPKRELKIFGYDENDNIIKTYTTYIEVNEKRVSYFDIFFPYTVKVNQRVNFSGTAPFNIVKVKATIDGYPIKEEGIVINNEFHFGATFTTAKEGRKLSIKGYNQYGEVVEEITRYIDVIQ